MTISVTAGRQIMGRLSKGDDLLAALGKICREHDISLGEVQALGAVSRARVGYYHQAEQNYEFLEFPQPLEILSLVGNVSMKDGHPLVHVHVTLADAEGRAFGGHLAEGTTVFACEFLIREFKADTSLTRRLDQETGLFLWPTT